MTLHLGFDQELLGLICLSCYPTWGIKPFTPKHKPPMFLYHGRKDPLIPIMIPGFVKQWYES